MLRNVDLTFVLITLCMAGSVKRGFVYCPAYPCTCESKDGSLIVNCRELYLSKLPKFISFEGRVKELALRGNNIRNLPASGFRGLHVEKLDLLQNPVTSINSQAFAGLEESLTHLGIQLYALNGLPLGPISALSRLKTLVIVGGKEPTLTREMFQNLTKLTELRLIGCRISHLHSGCFADLRQLRSLDLSQNSLRFQHLKEVNVLGKLAYLDMSYNHIQVLNNLAFSHLHKLRKLVLAFNKMTFIAERAFHSLDYSLESLDLSENELKSYALGSISYLKNLRTLDLSHNNITDLSKAFARGRMKLVRLSVSHNEIKSVSNASFSGCRFSLVTLELNNNPLEKIEHQTFSGFRKLEKINMNTTKLGGNLVNTAFDGVHTTLLTLDMSSAGFLSRDLNALANLSHVQVVNASTNQIQLLDLNVILNCQGLVTLDLSRNSISEIVGAPTLWHSSTSNLTSVDLSYNVLTSLPPCVFFFFPRLQHAKLEGNPLNCSCGLSWLYRWYLMTHAETQEHRVNWRCQYPAQLRDTILMDLDFSDFSCSDDASTEGGCLDMRTSQEPSTTQLPEVTSVTTTPAPCHLELNISRPNTNNVYVEWKTEGDAILGGFHVLLKQTNDSLVVDEANVSPGTLHHAFSLRALDQRHEVCVAALSDALEPLVEMCSPVESGSNSTELATSVGQQSTFQDSFVPLLMVYVSASMAAACLVAFALVCVRRNMKARSLRSSRVNSPGHNSPYSPGHPAWSCQQRPSLTGTSLSQSTLHSGVSLSGQGLSRDGSKSRVIKNHSNNSSGNNSANSSNNRKRYCSASTLPTNRLESRDGPALDTTMSRDLPPIVSSSRASSSRVGSVGGDHYYCGSLSSRTTQATVEDDFYFHF